MSPDIELPSADDVRNLLRYRYNGQPPCEKFVAHPDPDPDIQGDQCQCGSLEQEHVIYQLGQQLIEALSLLDISISR